MKGLELFGDKEDTAVKKELHHIHDLDTYNPMMNSDLSYKERREALASFLFNTEKRNGDIKAMEVADGSK